ncbi:MAG TPA: hypothetical protein VN258_15730 [Mobilitalea sp.]|nr:hypothetical protein [Mobilitalea sp.]
MQINELSSTERYLNPADIHVELGYNIEVFATGLDNPISMFFTEERYLVVAESGVRSEKPRILRYTNNGFEVLVDDFNLPITGVNYLNGIFYVSHKGLITRISREGVKQNIITGLPSNGDFYNGRVIFSSDRRKLYFGQGTATNSGVVGQDNYWVANYPYLCDYPGDYIILTGQNYETHNTENEFAPGELILTGAYSPYGIPNAPYETRKGQLKAAGSILRANLDGTELELYAWGFRNPSSLKFDHGDQLYVSNISYDNRGSRPIANAPDEFYAVAHGLWYGWPDYSDGEPVNRERFAPEGGLTPELLIKNHPNNPPTPFATFPVNSNIMGFDFDYNSFGNPGDVYIAEYGSLEPQVSHENISFAGAGHRISKLDIKLRTVSTFAINKSGFPSYISREGGFARPSEIAFGPDGAMYILDAGVDDNNNPNYLVPNTGVIWRITKNR